MCCLGLRKHSQGFTRVLKNKNISMGHEIMKIDCDMLGLLHVLMSS